MKKFAVGQVWKSRDGEKRVITEIKDGAEFPIYSETLKGEGQQVHTAEGTMYKGGDDHGGDLVKHVGFASKPEAMESLLSMLGAALSSGDEDENEGCDCADREFADKLIFMLAMKRERLEADELMTFVETVMTRRKALKF
jgi:hypothetical protein